MAQVNKYADRAAYTADAKRLSTKSAVSFIENETTTIYDGVNTVVGNRLPPSAISPFSIKRTGLSNTSKAQRLPRRRFQQTLYRWPSSMRDKVNSY